jgi:hypothetical protein
LRFLPPVLRVVARVLPITYAVSLLKGIWDGRWMVAAPGGCGGTDCFVSFFHCAVGEGFSVGVSGFR